MIVQGEVELISHGPEARSQVLPRRYVHGCQSRPCVSRNLGERHSFCAVFYPDAFHALFGVDLAAIQDALVDAAQVMPDHGLRLIDAVAEATSDAERCDIIDGFLATHATALVTTPWMRLRRMGVNIGLRIAGRLLGVGPRQVQRLARREGGMSVPSLSRLWRGERSLRQARESLGRGQAIDWASHAVDAGYADQSHLVRDCKELSGRTPTQIAQQARRDEADWIYRL